MPKSRAVQVSEPGGSFELIEREVPEPGPGRVRVRVRVEACGICHSDAFAQAGGWPGMTHPLIPGHEIAGTIDALGEGVEGWQVGEAVGVGWFGGNCGHCAMCRRGQLLDCENVEIPGITIDGGYAEHVAVRASGLARRPEGLSAEEAAPLMCAGITTFNALRHSGARPGDRVAVLGVGGLGHLAVQYAAKAGMEVAAVARGNEKRELAERLGAHHYVDSTDGDPAEKLQALGGIDVVLATATSASAMGAVFGGLRPGGRLIVLGAAMEPLGIPPALLIGGDKQIRGHASGIATDSEDTLHFSVLSGVRPMIETRPLEEAAQAFERMMSGEARFRMVLTTGGGE